MPWYHGCANWLPQPTQRVGHGKSIATERIRCNVFLTSISLQWQLSGHKVSKGVFLEAFQHTLASNASCNSANPLLRTPQRPPCPTSGARFTQLHGLPPCRTLTSTPNSSAILKCWLLHYCSPVLLPLHTPGMLFLFCFTPESSHDLPCMKSLSPKTIYS